MRVTYNQQLEQLQTQLIHMGALCEEAIDNAATALLEGGEAARQRAHQLEEEIDELERDIEDLCLKMLLKQQPVAGDLRQIRAAQKIIGDLERIGDQAADIAEITEWLENSSLTQVLPIEQLAQATSRMVSESIDAYVQRDAAKARQVIADDDTVDTLFLEIKQALIQLIQEHSEQAEACLDLLMVAKYLERIGDHAENVADWILFAVTGEFQ